MNIIFEREGAEQSLALKMGSIRLSARGDVLESAPGVGSPAASMDPRLGNLASIALERDRRIAEQHHRLEQLLQEMRAEIKSLRRDLEQSR